MHIVNNNFPIINYGVMLLTDAITAHRAYGYAFFNLHEWKIMGKEFLSDQAQWKIASDLLTYPTS